MKPEFLSEDEYKRFMSDGRKAAVDAGMPCTTSVVEVGAAGGWLYEKLTEAGLEGLKAQSICSNFGRKAFGKEKAVWSIAKVIFDRWRAKQLYGDFELQQTGGSP